jgi:hypothetical protein
MLKMKSLVNTPFTLCALVLNQNLKYAMENKEMLEDKLKGNKKRYEVLLGEIGYTVPDLSNNGDCLQPVYNFVTVVVTEPSLKDLLIGNEDKLWWYNPVSNYLSIHIQESNDDPTSIKKYLTRNEH